MNPKTLLTSAILVTLLAACGGQGNTPTPKSPIPLPGGGNPTPTPNPGSGGFSGTVLAPQGGGSVAGTLVIACYLEGQDCSQSKSKVVQAGSGGSFSMGAEAGSYLIVAWKDVNANQDIDSGDIIGGVLNDRGDDFALLSPPKSGLQVYTVVYQDPGSSGGTLAGSVALASGSGSIAGSVVVACYISGSECDLDSPNTKSASVTGSGAQGRFSLSVSGGQYGVFVFKDVNGDQTIGVGDLFGCYSTNGNDCLAVTPPKTDMSIELLPIAAGLKAQSLGTLSLQHLKPGLSPREAKRLLEGYLDKR